MSSKLLIKSAINFHFTRKCNFECKFCFHTKKTSFLLPIEKQLNLLEILKEGGAEKINFAGGEPFLYPENLGKLVQGAKEMGYHSTSIISNGSKIKRDFFEKYGKWLDILGISCDSVDPKINFDHGRRIAGSHKPRDETESIRKISKMATEFGILFKINTVVTSKNVHENMSQFINEINPMRWKVFQVLDVEGENYDSDKTKNELGQLLIIKEKFDEYIQRNKEGLEDKSIIIAEDNNTMRTSYILIDEYGRFLDSSNGKKTPTQSILDVGLEEALNELVHNERKGFDKDLFYVRGGYYPDKWTKKSTKTLNIL